mmetsp:Transcript_17858/g.53136  ORF Transcript_17858/g.53136 Transcript_17858/m.53136 type:complete len:198 (-) Transcript_17858:31-624(-)
MARALSLDESPPLRAQRKLAILGYRAAGKTALAQSFCTGQFVEGAYAPTIENTFARQLRSRRAVFDTELVDCAGMDEHSRLSRNASVGVHGYVLAYSCASRASFEKVRFLNDAVLRVQGESPGVARVLVATMCDLRQQRCVTPEEGQALARAWSVPYCECSAKEGFGVADVFAALVREVERDSGVLDPDPAGGCVLL